VKLTWDDDDPERNKLTRRTLSGKEIEESDFKAYLASSGSSDEDSDVPTSAAMKRDKLRALLLGGGSEDNELLPEGWGNNFEKAGEMEITFAPGLSKGPDDVRGEEETTLQRYLRKQKERRKQKTAKSERVQDEKLTSQVDEFFGEDSEDGEQEVAPAAAGKQKAEPQSKGSEIQKIKHVESTPAELELLVSSVEPEPKHFDMRSVVRAEKVGSKSRGRIKKKNTDPKANEDEAQEGFAINVKDDRFKALHEDHAFAIDPTNPQ
jgi:NUC153 domain